jgi:hypothetical protein
VEKSEGGAGGAGPALSGSVGCGWSGGGDVRARRRLNAATFEALQRAFDKGGQKAIEKVMKTQPAIFLKMLVLLVPRELQVEHSGSVKEMTDQQIEDAIAAIKAMIAMASAKAVSIRTGFWLIGMCLLVLAMDGDGSKYNLYQSSH